MQLFHCLLYLFALIVIFIPIFYAQSPPGQISRYNVPQNLTVMIINFVDVSTTIFSSSLFSCFENTFTSFCLYTLCCNLVSAVTNMCNWNLQLSTGIITAQNVCTRENIGFDNFFLVFFWEGSWKIICLPWESWRSGILIIISFCPWKNRRKCVRIEHFITRGSKLLWPPILPTVVNNM